METEILIILVGMSIVTQLPRVVPLVVISKLTLPPLLLKWLRHIPVAVLSALLVPSVLVQGGHLSLSLENPSLLASIPCMIIAMKTKNLFLTVLSGIAVMAVLQIW